MPYDFKLKPDELKSLIKEKVSTLNENYFCVINIDKDFTGVSEKEHINE